MSVPTGLVYFMTLNFFVSLFNTFLLVVFFLGLPVLLSGIVWWVMLTNRHSFRGTRRTVLSTALSYLDVKESGIENLGLIVHPIPPRQYVMLKLGGPSSLRRLFDSLSKESYHKPVSDIEREALETELRVSKMGGMLLVIMIPIFILVTIVIPPPMNYLILMLDIVFIVSSIWGVADYYKKAKRLKSYDPLAIDDAETENLSHLLRVLLSEYGYPLRLLVVRNHSELLYTGRIYTTSTNVSLHEAVFLPR